MSFQLFHVDAFTSAPFAGNPAAVCICEEQREDSWMQHLATEMNLSETAFLLRRGDGWHLRWFTPEIEVELCGHATLASAHVLYTHLQAPQETPLTFHTASGELRASRRGELIVLDFPAIPVVPSGRSRELAEALGVEPLSLSENARCFLAELDSEASVRALAPDMEALRRLGRRVIATAAGSGDFDFVSRFFAPSEGVPEDPVTGAAHCSLGPYWCARTGRTDFRAFQASRRGGTVEVGVRGDRVMLAGCAVTVFAATLYV
ncbi:MAG: PhzF family phenazine biosynthesis protein [Candidatus Schekmanbacteria bacterium]|nr:PhzF family phenazine biosynthesis protein [Candidatus Schekmanbacteria bacterium]